MYRKFKRFLSLFAFVGIGITALLLNAVVNKRVREQTQNQLWATVKEAFVRENKWKWNQGTSRRKRKKQSQEYLYLHYCLCIAIMILHREN
mmetsp:Transcript_6096/g.7692  ORF Transcript_6096/g.7692 Transcript_6096/m.7692 type:complete len:91 (+) Transcript_6096:439-711(+)